MPSPQDRKPLPKRQVFQEQVAARIKALSSQNRTKRQHEDKLAPRLGKVNTRFTCLIWQQVATLARHGLVPAREPVAQRFPQVRKVLTTHLTKIDNRVRKLTS